MRFCSYFYNILLVIVCKEGEIRLRNGSTPYEGRVEICTSNSWGTICNDGWSRKDALVACKQLSYSTIGKLYYIYNYITDCCKFT